ncbi:MAG TPA: hypothetical protein VFT45_03365 [Longimicrobium sp.]|nr:hypothetical protein [Longimicrobium sp.]
MDEADDPDPDDGWPVHPAAAFYGLWPRFAEGDEETDGDVAAESERAPAE